MVVRIPKNGPIITEFETNRMIKTARPWNCNTPVKILATGLVQTASIMPEDDEVDATEEDHDEEMKEK
jgi:hypothetical protein